jgi:hypothetical protein
VEKKKDSHLEIKLEQHFSHQKSMLLVGLPVEGVALLPLPLPLAGGGVPFPSLLPGTLLLAPVTPSPIYLCPVYIYVYDNVYIYIHIYNVYKYN